MSVIQTQLFLI